ncbi:MAG TPA: hypothetical protein VMN39_07115 [Longimicrobiaceae bacterium]|nr:hypothetical protein [Longimicrobiaceae bacterium]
MRVWDVDPSLLYVHPPADPLAILRAKPCDCPLHRDRVAAPRAAPVASPG